MIETPKTQVMTPQEKFVNGQYFKINEYGSIVQYDAEYNCIVDRFGRYMVSVDKIGRVYVKTFGTVLEKLVKVNIDLRKVYFIEDIAI